MMQGMYLNLRYVQLRWHMLYVTYVNVMIKILKCLNVFVKKLKLD